MGVGTQAEQVLGIRPRPYRALLCPYGWVPLTLHSKNKAIEKKYPPLSRAAGTFDYLFLSYRKRVVVVGITSM